MAELSSNGDGCGSGGHHGIGGRGGGRIRGGLAALAVAVLALAVAPPLAAQDANYDLLIRDGRVIDGTGNPAYDADVAVRDDEIVAVGDLSGATADRVIDASGLIVAPGFIDLHSHADRALTSEHERARQARSLVSQGLTTVLGGPDGSNQEWPLSEEVAEYREPGIGMNVVLMAGFNTIREEVLGEDAADYEHVATEDEIQRMREELRQAMEYGAWGLGAGLEYRPARFSSQEEVVRVADVVEDYDGFYIAHQRSEAAMPLWQLPSTNEGWPFDGLQGLEETINIARETGIRVVATHHKARGRSAFGRSGYDTILVNRARRQEGLDVYLDVYPYETFGGGARPMIPRWALVDDTVETDGGRDDPVYGRDGIFDDARSNLRRRWQDPETRKTIARDIEWIVDHNGGPGRVMVVGYPDTTWVGKSLAELAAEQERTVPEVVVRMALEGYPSDSVLGGAWTRGYGIHDVDVTRYYRQDYTATGSDAGVNGVEGVEEMQCRPGDHPRHFGAFTRRIAKYVKQENTTSLPFAIRSMTGLPAQIVGLEDRGRVEEGQKADLTIFDFEALQDRSTVLNPCRYSEGVEYVILNGRFTVDGGELTGALPGRVIRRE